MADKHRKRSPASLAVREMQFKTTMRCDFTPTRMPVIKRQMATKVGKEAESLEPSPRAGGRHSHFGKLWQFLTQLNRQSPLDQQRPS